jgi:hypothetical protein
MNSLSRKFSVTVLLVATILGWAAHGVADGERSPFRAQLRVEGLYEALRTPPSAAEREKIAPVRIAGVVFGEGHIDARFTLRRNKTWRALLHSRAGVQEDRTNPLLLQGQLRVGAGGQRIFPSAAAVLGNTLQVTFPGRVRGSRGIRQRIYTISFALDGSLTVTAKVTSFPSMARLRGGCAADVHSPPRAASARSLGVVRPLVGGVEAPAAPVDASQTARVVTISTDADPEWYARYGSQSNAVIASIINTAEAIYDRQLGIRFRLVKQHLYTDASPYAGTAAGSLLTAFVRNPENAVNLGASSTTFDTDVDLKHLFTGKDFDGSVVGIAYIGTVCAIPTLAYGITQAYNDVANPGIFAHEIGHNFGAYHDTVNRGTLMYPSLSVPPAETFSSTSLDEIYRHLGGDSSCLGSESVEPRPDGPVDPLPTPEPPPGYSISLSRQRVGERRAPLVRLFGVVRAANQIGQAGVSVQLMAEDLVVGSATTDEQGAFQFFVRVSIPRSATIRLDVRTLDGANRSNVVTLQRTRTW